MSDIPAAIPDWSGADAPLSDSVKRARATWRRRVMLEGAAATLATSAGLLVVLVLVGQVAGVTPTSLRVLRLVLAIGVVLAAAWWLLRPLLRRIDPARMALYLEENDPGLGQQVLSAVRAVAVPVERRASPALAARLASQATGALERIEHGAVIERPRVRRAGTLLAAVLAATAALLLFGPAGWRDLAAGLLTPWTPAEAIVPARSMTVMPGDVTVPRGSSLDIAAAPIGFAPSEAVLFLRRAGETEWTALPMAADSGGRFTLRLFDLDSTSTYAIEAGDVRSAEHRITVTELPAVRRVSLQLEYPDYTALPDEVLDGGGDVAAVIGTVVEVRTAVTMPVRAATLRFDDGRRIPLTLADSSAPVGRFRVARSGFYTIDLVAPDGTEIAGTVRWAVDALPDRPPVVRVFEPGRDTRATNIEEVALSIGADDDYGVRTLALRYAVNGGEEREVAVADGFPAGTLTPRGVHTLYLEELGLQAGDLVAYHAVAVDGAGNESRSDLYFIEVRPFSRNYRQSEQGAGGGGGGGGGGESPQQLSREQRELIVATYNVKRDSAGTPEERLREDIATLAVGQERLRDQLRQLSGQLQQRGAASVDSTFVEIKAALDSAATVMDEAVRALRDRRLDDALPVQQQALQQVQRAEALYRDVELQLNQGGGGGGGGGGGATPEDLADLFELETDRLRNQYEAVQRESAAETQSAQEVDEARERLRDLARRLEQENERQRRMAEAMQQRMAQSGGGEGGGGAQGGGGGQQSASDGGAAARRFAEEAEEEARRLERLARERNTPELQEAARQAREAADQLRRGAAGQPGAAGAAAESLREAARGVADGQESAARRATEELAGRAGELQREQQQFAREAAGLPAPGSADRDRATQQLRQEGEQLVRDAESLLRDLERTARDVRGTDPRAAAALGDAAGRMREYQVPERLEYSNRMAGDDRVAPQMLRDFNTELGRVIGEVRDRIATAAGAVGAAPERQRDRALENARELVRGMQALQDRTQPGAGQAPEGTPQSGEPGREGQGQPGQQPGQGQGQGEGQAAGQGQQPGAAQGGQQAGGGSPTGRQAGGGDARQVRGEIQTRLREAEGLRSDLRDLGLTSAPLDDAIATMRRLLRDGVIGDPLEMAALQAQALDQLMRAEFDLWQRIGGGESGLPAVGDPSRVPPRYRQLVEEYYRAIARDRP